MELDHAIWLLAGIAVGLVAAMLILAAMMAVDYRHFRRHRQMRGPPAPEVATPPPVVETAPRAVAAAGAQTMTPPPGPTSAPEAPPQSAIQELGAESVAKEEGDSPPAARVDVPVLFEQAFTGAMPASKVGPGDAPGSPGPAAGADKG